MSTVCRKRLALDEGMFVVVGAASNVPFVWKKGSGKRGWGVVESRGEVLTKVYLCGKEIE